ncbi:MAG: PAS domain S-box protein [Bacteroidetes bacterium]|nr:PAS domain S-box protein [Bacteroidota bacterium]
MTEKKILIVEDDKNIAFYAEEMILKLGYKVAGIAASGEDAVKLIEQCDPDIILMDITINGNIDGIETALIVKKKFNIPVIFMTSHSDDKTIQKAKIAEPYGYLVKPFEIKELKGTLQIAIYKKEADDKLKESERWYKSILCSISDGVIVIDQFQNIKFVNNVAEKLLGYSTEELIGENFNDKLIILPDTSSEGLVVFSKEAEIKGKPSEFNDKILVNKSGGHVFVEEKRSIIRNEAGDITGKVITISDISKRRNAQLQAIYSKDFYLNILEKFPVLIWRTNKNGEFNYFNSKWSEYTGNKLDSLIFKGWYDGIHTEDKNKFINLFESSFTKKEKFDTELRILRNDNVYHWFIFAGNPFNDIDGNFGGFIGACFDITKRKLMEDELKLAKDVSESSNNVKRTIISNVSHEIRTPLNGIMGLTDLLLDSKLDEEQTEFMEMIKQCGLTLLDLLNNLLDFSKLEDGKELLNIAPFNLSQIVDEIIQPYKIQLKRTQVDVILEIDETLPEILIGDGRKIKQIINNLVSNAVKFTEHGTISINVKLEKTYEHRNNGTQNKLLHFIVSDTGLGIPEEKLDIIFENFTQIDGSFTRKYSGTGLGLAIVKQLVEFMNGKIWVESIVGHGSHFHFVLELESAKNTINEKNVMIY